MRFRKTKLLVLQGDAIFEHLHGLAALRIQAAITEVDDWRLRLFAYEYARCRGHHLSDSHCQRRWGTLLVSRMTFSCRH